MFQIKAKLVYNQRVKGNYLHCALKAPKIAHNAWPGQFVSIRLTKNLFPLLRRPLSIHKVSASNIEFLYEIIGLGTEILAQKKSGEYLDLIGPLGNGFTYGLPFTAYHSPILVAGGMGVAPLVFLAQMLAKQRPVVLIGAKTKGQIICEKEFQELGSEIKISTDDGSRGFKGKVTGLLRKILPLAISNKPLAIYACGPRPMLEAIASISQQHDIPAQVSLEEHLACGIGACFGCAVNTKQGFKRVCKEGPVFNADEIVWG